MLTRYIIQEIESGNEVEQTDTLEEAEEIIAEWVSEDFYEIKEVIYLEQPVYEDIYNLNTMSLEYLEEYKKDLEEKDSRIIRYIQIVNTEFIDIGNEIEKVEKEIKKRCQNK